jgi:pimeloyl-ACP methyl ester carboxylesterase
MPPAGSTAIDDYARAAVALADALHLDRFVVGGVSMGGYVACGVLRLAGGRCNGLVMADSRAGADTEQGRTARDAMLRLVREGGPPAVADDMIPKLLGETTRTQRPDAVRLVRSFIEAQTTEGIAAAIVRLRDRPDSTDVLRALQVPALIVVGEEDTLTPVVESERMRDAIPRADLVRIPSAGHLASLEAPGAFNAALARYLNSLDR